MLRQPFEQQQRRLRDKVLVLGSQTEEALRNSVEALAQGDLERAKFLGEDGSRRQRHCGAG